MNLHAITVTLNPAIDQTIQLDSLQPGAVHRASSVRNDAGGKGINVAACLADWGSQVAALGVLGAGNAGVFEALFRERGITDHCQRVAGETRTNLKLVEARSNDTTDINLPGLRLGQPHLQGVADHLAPLLRPGLPVVLSGSLPAGLPDDSWAQPRPRPAPPVRACCWTPVARRWWPHSVPHARRCPTQSSRTGTSWKPGPAAR